MWLLILIKVRIAERVIEIMKKLSEKMGRRLLLLIDGKHLIVEVVVRDAFSATRLYANIVGRRDMINTRVCLKNKGLH